MHPFLLLLLSLTLILLLSAASSLPLHLSQTHLRRRNSASAPTPPQQYIEVTRPLPFDSVTPSCTLPLLSHTFSAHHLTNAATYSSPTNCSWSNAVLHFSAASSGSHRGRIAALWLSGAELARTSTPDPTPEGTFWNFRKDVTRYASLLRRSNLTLSLILHSLSPHLTDDTYHVNVTFAFYNTTVNAPLPLFRHHQNTTSLELDENPADLITPISATGDEQGHWFKIANESDSVFRKFQIPSNTYRAVIEIYVSSHHNDEFWYSNPPDSYLEINNLTTNRGHGSHREVVVKLDDTVVGGVIPFPAIYGGGIDPLFWQPLVSIGAFDLPSYELELTPFLGMLLDGGKNPHFLGLEVAEALPYWMIGANLHLWLDRNGDKVSAGPIEYSDPHVCLERESKFDDLDGKFKIEGERKSEASGWVRSSAGNFTTHAYSKAEFSNKIVVKHNGTKMRVKQEVKVVEKVHVRSDLGHSVAGVTRERRYPLRVTATVMPGSERETYLIAAELEQAVKEEKKESGGMRSKSENRQKCRGWMFVRECQILSGAATTTQSYYGKDGKGCYVRRVLAEGGAVRNDTHTTLCAPTPIFDY